MRKTNDNVVKPTDSIDTLIGSGAVIKGDLEFSGGLRVDGKVVGNIFVTDSNNATLALSESAVVEGDVSVPHVVVNGTVKGNITSTGHIELQEQSRVTGDVTYKAVEMALGAVLNGKLISQSSSSPVYDLIDGGVEEDIEQNEA